MLREILQPERVEYNLHTFATPAEMLEQTVYTYILKDVFDMLKIILCDDDQFDIVNIG